METIQIASVIPGSAIAAVAILHARDEVRPGTRVTRGRAGSGAGVKPGTLAAGSCWRRWSSIKRLIHAVFPAPIVWGRFGAPCGACCVVTIVRYLLMNQIGRPHGRPIAIVGCVYYWVDDTSDVADSLILPCKAARACSRPLRLSWRILTVIRAV